MAPPTHGYAATLGVAAALVLLAVAVYSGTYRHAFTGFDDNLYVTDNRHVLAGLSLAGLRWAFTAFYATNWHPLTWLSHMLDVSLFGVAAGPHLLVNAGFHAANSVLLFLVLHRMTGSFWRSAAVAALFVVHPLHVESVAWIAQRKDVLCSLFFFLALLAYVRHAARPAPVRLLPVAGLYSLGLLAKPMIVTFPFLLLLLDAWPLGRLRTPGTRGGDVAGRFPAVGVRAALLEKAPLLVLAATSCVVTYVAQAQGGAVAPLKMYPFGMRVGNAIVACACYLGKTLWPSGLAAYYPHPGSSLTAPSVAAAAGILAAVTLLCLAAAKRRPWLGVGWLWFLGMLVPVIGLVQVGGQAMADRYAYLPVVGLFVAAAWGIPDLVRQFRFRTPMLVAAAVVATIALGATARIQTGYWKNGVTLFTRALAVTRNNVVAHVNLGASLGALGRLPEAVHQFREALGIRPDDEIAHNNLGVALEFLGRADEAIRHLGEAVRLWPDYGLAHLNLAEALHRIGKTAQSLPHYMEAMRLRPEDGYARFVAGTAMDSLGYQREAERLYAEAVAVDASLILPRIALGAHLASRGEVEDAIRLYEEALRVSPSEPLAYFNLGVALQRSGREEEAIRQFRRAAQLMPGDPRPRVNLGLAFDRMGRTEEAILEYREALCIAPMDSKANNNLGAALARAGRIDEALPYFAAAVRADPDDGSAHQNCGMALQIMGRHADARIHLAKARALGIRRDVLPALLPVSGIQTSQGTRGMELHRGR